MAAVDPLDWTQEQAERYFDDATTCDRLLQVADRIFHVHSALLATRSAFFAGLLGEGFAEQQKTLIALDIPAPSPAAAEHVLKHLYTGSICNVMEFHYIAASRSPEALAAADSCCTSFTLLEDLLPRLTSAAAKMELLAAMQIDWQRPVSTGGGSTLAVLFEKEVLKPAFADTLESTAVTRWLSGAAGEAMQVAAEHLPCAAVHAAFKRERAEMAARVQRLEDEVDSHESLRKCTRCDLRVSAHDIDNKTHNATSDCVVAAHTGTYRAGYSAGWSCCEEKLKKSEPCGYVNTGRHIFTFI
ncbi:hypothetical protein JKP88DRAFT_247432 [Tribonema minus]|uniref:BTB domain-containing protein n=1 Tax=Tribonema minus TaxID=303371 RepID=A0A835YQT2_9STRA|nr:hypothetical protein JKP88DRAFT_247432 [Tribonema minus]